MAETTLSWYLNDTAELVSDSNYLFTSKKQMTRWINLARRQVAMRTGCMQALVTGQSPFGASAQPGSGIPGAMTPGALPGALPNNQNSAGAVATASNNFVTIPGVEKYSYNFGNKYLQQQYAGYKSIVYVFNVACSWGGIRPVLNWMPWNELEAYCRSYNIGAFAYPFVWSSLGIGENGEVWLFPCPSTSNPGQMEWQCNCIPIELYSDSDYEAIPHPFQNAVKWYAAGMIYYSSQRTAQARLMMQEFESQLGISTVASDMGHIPSYYPGDDL